MVLYILSYPWHFLFICSTGYWERGVVISNKKLSVSFFSFVSFCFICFEVVLLGAYIFSIMSSGWIDFCVIIKCSYLYQVIFLKFTFSTTFNIGRLKKLFTWYVFSHLLIFLKNRPYCFRAVLGSQQNWAGNAKISHIPPAPRNTYIPLSISPTRVLHFYYNQ